MTLCCSWSLPVFFTAAHCRSLLGASISHFSHPRYQIFVFFFQRNSGISLFIIAGSSCFSVIYVIVSSKITSKKTRLCCWFLLSKRTVGHAISRQKHLECMWCGQTDGLTVTWLPKLLGWMDYQIFLGTGQRSRASRGAPCSMYRHEKEIKCGKICSQKTKFGFKKTHKKRRIAESFHNVAFFKLLLSDTEHCHDLYAIIHCSPSYPTKKSKTAETASGRATGWNRSK